MGSRPIVAISFYFLIFFPGLDGLLLPPPPALDGKVLDSWETSIDCISLLNLLPICFYCAEINIDYSAQIANITLIILGRKRHLQNLEGDSIA